MAARGLKPNSLETLIEQQKPRGAGAVMASRVEASDSLDFFPTPPWATRALIECVLQPLGLQHIGQTVHEPACGAGHMAEVLREYFGVVMATDVAEYGYHSGSIDFLAGRPDGERDFDWIITNPPFRLAEPFVLRALQQTRVGVAMLVRSVWAEGGARYANIFSPHPPVAVAQFSERVPMVKGRWDPIATTATSYSWFVWAHLKEPQPTRFTWIPPGQRQRLTKPDDAARFATVAS